jgi:Ca2+-binding RTX toxin-like protein
MTAVLIPPPPIESLSHFDDVDQVILGEEYNDDFTEEISGLKYVYNLAGGNDSIDILSTSDSSELHLNSGAGNDTVVLTGAFGNYTILGGHGKDKIVLNSYVSSISLVSGGDGKDRIIGTGSIIGGGGNDILKVTPGDRGNVSIWGCRGKDILRGGFGSDYLSGGQNSDVIKGNAGDDMIVGGGGSDKLVGGIGDDYIKGGVGSDTLIGGQGSDIFDIGGGDIVKDFSPSEDDLIYIDEDKYGSNITASDTAEGVILASGSGLEVLIADASVFVVQMHLNFY